MKINPTTLLFEIVNFLLLVWLLSRLLYKPLRRAIAERERALELERTQTKEALEHARELERSWQDKSRALDALAEQVRSDALAGAVAEQGRMLTRAREEAAAERGKAEALLHSEREAAERWVRSMAIERSSELAGEMLLTLAPEAIENALTERLIDELQRRGADLVGAEHLPDDLEVEVVGAQPARQAVLERLRGALAEALSVTPRLAVREDPSLRAGLLLRVGDRVIDASLAGKLQAFEHLARELADRHADG